MNARFRFVLGLAVILNLVFAVFLSGTVVQLRTQVADLSQVLATKEDLIAVNVPQTQLFTEEKCTRCHTERRFAGEHSTRGEIEAAVAHMRAMPDVGLTDQDMAKIHASLSLLRCTRCHGEEKLRTLALKSPEERMSTIRRMIASPGSGLLPDQMEEIQRAYREIYGF
jgi:hypothetical protein